jgi:hypothetical protein
VLGGESWSHPVEDGVVAQVLGTAVGAGHRV